MTTRALNGLRLTLLGAVLIGLFLLAMTCDLRWTSSQPSIILISVDTLRSDHLGAYGYDKGTSTNLDALARRSILFEQAVANAPATLCSHASLLASLLPIQHGASFGLSAPLADSVLTVTEVLRASGYATASFNGGGQIDPLWGLSQGFDIYESHSAPSPSTSLAEPDTLGLQVAKGLAWIDTVRSRAPFFLFLHTYEVHHPYEARREFFRPTDPTFRGEVDMNVPVELLRDVNEGRKTITRADLQRIIDCYDAGIRSADAAIGFLVEQLAQRKLLDDTTLVITSDHGEEFREHGYTGWHSHTLYDELLRVPLLIKLPKARRGGERVRRQVSGVDLAPTLLAVAGIAPPPAFVGRSLLDIEEAERPAFAWTEDWKQSALRTSTLKQYNGWLLDLVNDPKETVDLAWVDRGTAVALRAKIEDASAAVGQQQPRASAVLMTELLQEQLVALGYMQGSVATSESSPSVTHPAPMLPMNTRISFGQDAIGNQILGEGWSLPEAGFVWTESSSASMRFAVRTNGEPALLQLQLSPFLNRGGKGQRVRVAISGTPVDELIVTRTASFAIALPVLQSGSPVVDLTLELPDATAPAETGLSADLRKLGVAIHSLLVRPIPVYAYGTVISARIGGDAKPYLVRGWNEPEVAATWATEDAELWLGVEPIGDDLELEATVSPLLFAPVSRQRLRAWANTVYLGEWSISKPTQLLRLTVPSSETLAGLLRLRFVFPDAVRPHELGLNADGRKLSVAFSSLALRKLHRAGNISAGAFAESDFDQGVSTGSQAESREYLR